MYYPLLDIQDAIRHADRCLADVVRYVDALQGESEGHGPPAASQFLANIAAAREMLGGLMPPALQEAIAEEQRAYEEDEAQYGG